MEAQPFGSSPETPFSLSESGLTQPLTLVEAGDAQPNIIEQEPINPFAEIAANAITAVLSEASSKRVHVGKFIRSAFGRQHIDNEDVKMFNRALGNDPRVTFRGNARYKINGSGGMVQPDDVVESETDSLNFPQTNTQQPPVVTSERVVQVDSFAGRNI